MNIQDYRNASSRLKEISSEIREFNLKNERRWVRYWMDKLEDIRLTTAYSMEEVLDRSRLCSFQWYQLKAYGVDLPYLRKAVELIKVDIEFQKFAIKVPFFHVDLLKSYQVMVNRLDKMRDKL